MVPAIRNRSHEKDHRPYARGVHLHAGPHVSVIIVACVGFFYSLHLESAVNILLMLRELTTTRHVSQASSSVFLSLFSREMRLTGVTICLSVVLY